MQLEAWLQTNRHECCVMPRVKPCQAGHQKALWCMLRNDTNTPQQALGIGHGSYLRCCCCCCCCWWCWRALFQLVGVCWPAAHRPGSASKSGVGVPNSSARDPCTSAPAEQTTRPQGSDAARAVAAPPGMTRATSRFKTYVSLFNLAAGHPLLCGGFIAYPTSLHTCINSPAQPIHCVWTTIPRLPCRIKCSESHLLWDPAAVDPIPLLLQGPRVPQHLK
jgi:hypothetical protein